MEIELCVFLKIDLFGQIQAWGTFQDFSQVFFHSHSLEDHKIDMLKKFEQFITISLTVVFV